MPFSGVCCRTSSALEFIDILLLWCVSEGGGDNGYKGGKLRHIFAFITGA